MQTTPSGHKRSNRILILHREGNLFNNPSLKCIIDLLLEKGYGIDIRYKKSPSPMPRVKGVRLLPFGNVTGLCKAIISDLLCSWPLIVFSVFFERLFLYGSYDLLLGVDRHGLIEASILSKLTKTPYVFISFEIMFKDETSCSFKSLERKASKGVCLWIVQDEVRAQQLQSENLLQPSRRFLLPLSSAGPGLLRTERLRDRLGIPKEKKIAIAIGSVFSWSMITQIIRSAADWPDDWVLIVHERYGRTKELLAADVAAARELIGSKIFISDAAAEVVDDMGNIFSGVSAGLAFYKPDFVNPDTGKNLAFLGMAAGKVSTYLRYGVPVIMNEIGLYAEEARRERFGCVVDSPANISTMLDEIDQEAFRINARRYFEEKLDFNLYKKNLWTCLSSAMNNISCSYDPRGLN